MNKTIEISSHITLYFTETFGILDSTKSQLGFILVNEEA